MCDDVAHRRRANLPANRLTPTLFARAVEQLFAPLIDEARARGALLSVATRDEQWLRAHGCGGHLAVAQGSAEPPRFVVVHYASAAALARRQRPVAFVGKGVTFDAGGISIKPSAKMAEVRRRCAAVVVVVCGARPPTRACCR